MPRVIDRGTPVVGCWLQLFNPAIGEMLGLCGYDFLMLDMEHGLGTVADAASVMRAVRGTGAASLVRVPSNDPVVLKTLMDQGADGLMIPMVETADQAHAAVAACRYPPLGTRGMATGIARGARYGLDVDYVAQVNSRMTIICQIETAAGVARAADIAAVDGVDMIFIGWNDLAATSGHILQLDHPEVTAMVDEVIAVTRAAGKRVGMVPSAGRSWQNMVASGIDLVIPSSDISIVRGAGQVEVAAFRTVTGRPPVGPMAQGY